jgi:chromosome segregation ATPase
MIRFFSLLVILGASLGGRNGLAETYRWVDENGAVHYSDQVPPDQAMHRRSRLSPQGRELGVIEGAKSAEQLAKEKQLADLRAEQDRILAEQRDRDLSLLRTYRTEEEMHLALRGKLNSLDASIKINEANRQRQQDILATQEKRAADLERQGQAVSRAMLDGIEAARRQVANYEEAIMRLQKEKLAISERYAKDIARFNSIKSQHENLAPRSGRDLSILTDSSGIGNVIISAVGCQVGAVCNKAWSLARAYVLRNSAGNLSIETEKILQTAKPLNDRDITLTVTRIAGKGEDILFLDIRCRQSSVGEEICSGPKVRDIRVGFRPFIEEGLLTK